MRILFGVTSTAPSRRNPHVVPAVVVSDISISRLPDEEGGDGRASSAALRRAAAAQGLLPGVWEPGGDPPGRAGPLAAERAGGSGLHLADRDAAASGVPVLRDRTADPLGPGGRAADLHPLVRPLRAGAVAAHDHQGRGGTPGRELGHRQGHSEAAPAAALRQARVEARPSDRDRRDLRRPRLPLPDAGAGPGQRSHPVRRRKPRVCGLSGDG